MRVSGPSRTAHPRHGKGGHKIADEARMGAGRRSLRPKIMQSYDEVYEYVCSIIGEGVERGYAERGGT